MDRVVVAVMVGSVVHRSFRAQQLFGALDMLPARCGWLFHCLILACVSPAMVHAYSTPSAFGDAPLEGGGGGRFFTGSPAEGYDCSLCHSPQAGSATYPLYASGLPVEGYRKGERREVVVSWPQFAAYYRAHRPDPTEPTGKDDPLPAMGLLAEFVAESGSASGTVEINVAQAGQAARCERTRPNLEPKVGATMYQVRPLVDPIRLRPDRSGILRCEAGQLGQRCLLAMDSCGAEELRFTWTAPDRWEGPIWFAAGFVASEVLSGSYDDDTVTSIAVPLVQAGTPEAGYVREVQGSCSSTGRFAADSGVLWPVALGLWLLWRRGRSSASVRGPR